MAFDATKMNAVHVGTKRLYVYDGGSDTIATIAVAGYFAAYYEHLDVADVIIVLAETDTGTCEVQLHVVIQTNSTTVITVKASP